MAKTLLLVLTLVLLSVNVKAQSPAQLDPNQVVSQFLRAFNSNDFEAITHYVDNNLSEETAARWQGAGTKRYISYTMNSSLTHKSLQQVGDIAQEEQQQRVRITAPTTSKATGLDYELVINVGSHAPYSLISWYLTPSDRNKPNGKVSEAEMVKTLSELINKLVKNGVFSGTVLLAKGEEVLLQQAHGLASRRYDVKNNLETKFQIGSMNKMFTAVAIMQLVEAGKLSLNDKLTQYVDREYFGSGNFDAITIAQLLTHTSGLGAVPGYQAKQTEIRTLKQRLGLYKEVQLNFAPGSRWGYSSTGMDMLGHVIEAVTQQSYYDYIDDNIYQKAKMLSSGSFDIDLPVKNTARGYWYSIDTKAITENLVSQHVKGSPAGGGYSTVGDLHQFALALMHNRLIAPKLTSQAMSAKPQLNSPNYGFGFSVRGEPGNQIIGHNGAQLGMSSQLNIYKDKGYILAVLANTRGATAPVVYTLNNLMERLEYQ